MRHTAAAIATRTSLTIRLGMRVRAPPPRLPGSNIGVRHQVCLGADDLSRTKHCHTLREWCKVRSRVERQELRKEDIWRFKDEAHGLPPHPRMLIASIVTYESRKFVWSVPTAPS